MKYVEIVLFDIMAHVPNITQPYNPIVKDCGLDRPKEGKLQPISINPGSLKRFAVRAKPTNL